MTCGILLLLFPLHSSKQAHQQALVFGKLSHISSDSTGPRHHMLLSVSAIIAISAAIFIVLGVIVINLANISARKRLAFVDHALESMFSSSSRSGAMATGKLVLFDSRSSPDWISDPETLLNKANEIREGVYGTVYKVSLGGSEGKMAAIKKLVTSI